MEKINFVNKPNTDTPINADNLNLLQDNVEESIDSLENNINGTILYEDAEGTIENITLSDYVTNYKIIDIFYRDDNYIFASSRLAVINGAWYTINVIQYDSSIHQVIIRGKNIQLSNKEIINGNYCALVLSGGGVSPYWNNNIVIYKVIGYK